MHKVFETERLLIRPTSEDDSELIYQLMNTPKFIKYVGDRAIDSVEAGANYIRTKMLPQLHTLGYSNYTIIIKSEGQKIGTCGLYKREGVDGIDIGFALLPPFEGLGYGYEASHRLLKAAFEDFGIHEIKGITTKDNSASQRLLEKLGLQLNGTTRLPNDDEELLLYKIVKEPS